MNTHNGNGDAVSEVVGEMLMIGLVIILVAVFSTAISSFMPTERYPSISIRLTNETPHTITLWHKGGDWVKVSDLRIIVRNSTDHATEITFRSVDSAYPVQAVPKRTTFDLDTNITVVWDAMLDGNETVKLATSKAVIFSGHLGKAEA